MKNLLPKILIASNGLRGFQKGNKLGIGNKHALGIKHTQKWKEDASKRMKGNTQGIKKGGANFIMQNGIFKIGG